MICPTIQKAADTIKIEVRRELNDLNQWGEHIIEKIYSAANEIVKLPETGEKKIRKHGIL